MVDTVVEAERSIAQMDFAGDSRRRDGAADSATETQWRTPTLNGREK